MISKLFIERPRLAVVISLVITLAGLIALLNISVAQYPKITPPEIVVRASYPGASAEVVAQSVAAPIEAQVNGVENMIYMTSTSGNDGSYSLTVTFDADANADIAQVNVLNRLKQAESKLPNEVVAQGLTVRARSSDMLAIINFFSPKGTRDQLFLSNFVSINVQDALARINGISDANIFGELSYSMRVWMDPERLTALGLSASDINQAIASQNIQAAAGALGSSPGPAGQQLQYPLRAKGRLVTVEDFSNIVVRVNKDGGVLRLGDVARVELGAQSYAGNNLLDGAPAVPLGIYQSSDANALETMDQVRAELERLARTFPDDIEYRLTMDATLFVRATIHEIVLTLLMTFALVVGVTYVFLQDWRATLIPTLTIPVSLIGAFAALLALGYSANIITLFALILAIGVVVDDAIVVVENVQRILDEERIDAKSATIKAMGQVTGPIIAATLVLLAMFLPVAFLPGITGRLYQQFAVTICFAVLLSGVCALTLSPALCAIILRPAAGGHQARRGPLGWFEVFLGRSRNGYVRGAGWLAGRRALTLGLLALVLTGGYLLFVGSPTSFLPDEDQGLFYLEIQLPPTASLERTSLVSRRIHAAIKDTPGIAAVTNINGRSALSGTGENLGRAVIMLKPWDERTAADEQLPAIIKAVQARVAAIPDADIRVITPPAIRGMGSVGGFDFRLQAFGDQTPQDLAAATGAMVVAANQDPNIQRAFSSFTANAPQIYIDLDRVKAQSLGVPVGRVFETLQAQLGSKYVNDFNLFNRVYQVKIQADAPYRDTPEAIGQLYVRSDSGAMTPLSTLVSLKTTTGPQVIYRYNQFPSTQINGAAAEGKSSGQAMAAMAELARRTLPQGYGFDWSGLSYQEQQAGGQTVAIFLTALLFGYLFLVAQYESWSIPLTVILSISVAVLGALAGLFIFGRALSIYGQIGLVLLLGLASKNAILIVEFAKTSREAGAPIVQAAMDGARVRFRAVLMTAFSFILGVFPLVVATGAGAASRRDIGVTVFFGMLAATMLGIFLIPPLFVVLQGWREGLKNFVRARRGEKP